MQFNIVLNEISKASTMKAAIALSKFLQIPVGITITPVETQQIDEIKKIAEPQETVVSLFVPIKSNLTGGSFFIYSQQAALAICDILLNRSEGTTKIFNDGEISALSEVANIVIGNFLSAFAQSLQLEELMHRTAIFKTGTFESIIDQLIPSLSNRTDSIVIKISFGFQHEKNIKGHVIIVFEEEKIANIMQNISLTT